MRLMWSRVAHQLRHLTRCAVVLALARHWPHLPLPPVAMGLVGFGALTHTPRRSTVPAAHLTPMQRPACSFCPGGQLVRRRREYTQRPRRRTLPGGHLLEPWGRTGRRGRVQTPRRRTRPGGQEPLRGLVGWRGVGLKGCGGLGLMGARVQTPRRRTWPGGQRRWDSTQTPFFRTEPDGHLTPMRTHLPRNRRKPLPQWDLGMGLALTQSPFWSVRPGRQVAL
mmetsp:Transcript_8374/g.19266  ORF Transcript_8374/g.19266 Transcript_8374/m.19266 type:complete len:223 (+) Transcript_8374:2082-2750(+)